MKAQRLLKVDPIRIAGLEKATAVHLENRKTVIQHAISVVSSEKESRWAKRVGIRTLGQVRAAEAAPLLAGMIDARIPTGRSRDATMENLFACVPTLVKIGKPGAVACLDAIVKLTPEERERPIKERLLCRSGEKDNEQYSNYDHGNQRLVGYAR